MTNSPVTKFHEQNDDEGPTRLTVASERVYANQRFSLEELDKELSAKLEEYRYPQPPEPKKRKTFHQVLLEHDALHVLLSASVLQRVWRCLLLPAIREEDQRLRTSAIAVDGHPIKFHRAMATKLKDHEKGVTAILSNHGVEADYANGYLESIGYRIKAELSLVARTMKPKSKKAALSGYSSPQLAVQVALYDTFKRCFRAKNLRDKFLRQLCILVSTKGRNGELESDESLRKVLDARTKSRRKSLQK